MNIIRIFTRNKTCVSLMGRWGMINDNSKYADKNIDWANHDHCGGELCSYAVYPLVSKSNSNSNLPMIMSEKNELMIIDQTIDQTITENKPDHPLKNKPDHPLKNKEIIQYNYTKFEMDYDLPYVI